MNTASMIAILVLVSIAVIIQIFCVVLDRRSYAEQERLILDTSDQIDATKINVSNTANSLSEVIDQVNTLNFRLRLCAGRMMQFEDAVGYSHHPGSSSYRLAIGKSTTVRGVYDIRLNDQRRNTRRTV